MNHIFSELKVFDIDPSKLRSKNFYEDFVVKERNEFWEQRKVLNKSTENATCFLCGSVRGHEEFLVYEGYQLMQCPTCDAIFANITVDENYTSIVYNNQTYSESIEREVVDTFEYRKNTFGKERLAYIVEKCGFEVSRHSLLDVGCGAGYMLKYLNERNIRCEGLEVTDYLVRFCRELGLNVSDNKLSEVKGLFNVVTMFDVLEHLAEPITVFNEANEKLENGGCVLAYTPNILSFAFHFQGGKQNLLLPYEHLCFYTEKSLHYLARETGFEVASVDYFGLDIVDYFSMKQFEDGVPYNSNLKEIIPYLQALVDKQNISNHMRVVFKKVS